MKKTIPKTIHYCWFGTNPLPKTAKKCIESWKKFLPDYQIIQWNEKNYDISKIPYIRQAYAEKKYAYVSDYARFDILYQYGGIYFDTDVEVIKSLEDIITQGPFFACEINGTLSPLCTTNNSLLDCPYSSFSIRVSPGLGMGVESGNPFYKEFLDLYKDLDFIRPDGSYNQVAVVRNTTTLLVAHGLKDVESVQKIAGFTIYPQDYFNPYDSLTGILNVTENTCAIHWYSLSWLPSLRRIRVRLMRMLRRFVTVLKGK